MIGLGIRTTESDPGLTVVVRRSSSLETNLRGDVLAQLTDGRVETFTKLRRRVWSKVFDAQLAGVVVVRQTANCQTAFDIYETHDVSKFVYDL